MVGSNMIISFGMLSATSYFVLILTVPDDSLTCYCFGRSLRIDRWRRYKLNIHSGHYRKHMDFFLHTQQPDLDVNKARRLAWLQTTTGAAPAATRHQRS